MKSRVTWLENVAFQAETESGHQLTMDGSPAYGGENRGARPMELILTGLGGCASFDVVTILKKARQDVHHVECLLEAERAETIPAVFTKIHLHFIIKGKGIKEKQVEKALELSASTYCSASRMLTQGGVEITHDYEIIEIE
ncbi:OsmC family protein [Moraxella sp. ZY210820]|uniref:OsmC family protein n=1 Tax=unclassified Moraxella TaxID=2685852 RepID=UPI00272F6B37|nr:OsmC family protein [Moraxella sp. ZY210820]WLF84628.1 OsmC family protein [Moraxella sp. ZY210820]